MTNDYRKGWRYRARTDANFRRRRRYASETRRARARLLRAVHGCQSNARTPHRGPLELHHVAGDLSGRRGYRILCRRHNRQAANQRAGRMTKPWGG